MQTHPTDTISLRQQACFDKLVATDLTLSWQPKNDSLIVQAAGLSDFVAKQLDHTPALVEHFSDAALMDIQDLDYNLLLQEQLALIDMDGSDAEQQLFRTLRQFRRYHMMRLACQDLLNVQPIERSLQKVSALADALIIECYQWLYHQHCRRYGTPMGEFGPQPLLILGMGKLGGRELNFSSDIDLIFFYPENGEITNGRKPVEHQPFFTKLAQKLIGALHQTTVDGQVFRVDMRLRPFGDSGPLTMHFPAVEDYYQEQGREWERYAMIKARILNPKCAYSEELSNILKPFVYRRYLDYGAIDSLRKMKGLISQEVRRRGLTDNIKLGQGGIREVEFIVQSFQLIKGGRETELQSASLLDVLNRLPAHELLSSNEATALRESYLFLRKVEHCLQQFNDEQTQILPQSELDQQRLIQVMEFASYTDFLSVLQKHMNQIHHQFQLLVGNGEGEDGAAQSHLPSIFSDLWMLDLDINEMREALPQWQEHPVTEDFFAPLLDFKHWLQKRGLTQRGADTLNLVMPSILHGCLSHAEQSAEQVAENQTLPRLIDIFKAIMGRTTYLQLLAENQGAQQQLVRLCHASPWIAAQLSRYPILLDELLNPATLYHPTELEAYPSELRQMLLRVDPDDLETQMEVLRQFKQIQQLKIAAADVTGALPIMKVSDHLTFLAEAIVNEVVNMAWQQMVEKYGAPIDTDEQNKGFAVIGYGKFGGIELGYGSDLDLVFLHQCQTSAMTQGAKSIEAGLFYTKLAQRILHLFMTKTPSGQLYEVDMRLRPSGNAGLLVCHIHGFSQYQLAEAWTWEHQALVRARVISAQPAFAGQFDQIRHQVLAMSRPLADLQEQVVQMRRKMRENLNQGSDIQFDLKQDSGAMVDIEFLVQYWVLANVSHFPELSKWSDNVRIINDLSRLNIIDKAVAEQLIESYLVYRNSAHRLTLLGKKALQQKHLFIEHQQKIEGIWQSTFGDQS